MDDWGYAGGALRVYTNDYGIPGGFTGGHTRAECALRWRGSQAVFGAWGAFSATTGFTWSRTRRIPSPRSGISARAGAASGSLGALLQLTGQLRIGASLGRAFRTPDVNELYSEGPHLAAYAFEIGNPSLETERGLGIDVFGRLAEQRFSAEVTWFRNAITGYVFPLETGELSRVRLPIYQFESEDAVLTGFESVLGWLMPGGLEFEAVASYVRGTIRATDEPIPLMPPLQGRLAVGYSPVDWFVEAEARVAARQERTGMFERPTDGYAVFDLSGGMRLTLDGRLHVVTLRIENLGDTEYRNHLSRVKEIMPEAGRALSVSYRVVF